MSLEAPEAASATLLLEATSSPWLPTAEVATTGRASLETAARRLLIPVVEASLRSMTLLLKLLVMVAIVSLEHVRNASEKINRVMIHGLCLIEVARRLLWCILNAVTLVVLLLRRLRSRIEVTRASTSYIR